MLLWKIPENEHDNDNNNDNSNNYNNNNNYKHWDGAYLCQGMSYQCRDISPPSGKSVRDHHQNLTICSLAHCQPSMQISCKPIPKFLRKLANRQKQPDKQTTTKT